MPPPPPSQNAPEFVAADLPPFLETGLGLVNFIATKWWFMKGGMKGISLKFTQTISGLGIIFLEKKKVICPEDLRYKFCMFALTNALLTGWLVLYTDPLYKATLL